MAKKIVPWNKKTNKVARSKAAGEGRAADRKKKAMKKNESKSQESKWEGEYRAGKRDKDMMVKHYLRKNK